MTYRAQRFARKQGTVIHKDRRTRRRRTRAADVQGYLEEDDVSLEEILADLRAREALATRERDHEDQAYDD